MVKCPRCESIVDETIRTTCPICFTPVVALQTPEEAPPPTETADGFVLPSLTGAPQPLQPAAAPPSLPGSQPTQPPYSAGTTPRPGVRVSLTGEVIEEAMMESSPPPSYTGGANAQSPLPTAPAAAPRPVPRTGRAEPEVPEGERHYNSPIPLVIIMGLVVVGWFAWGWWTNRTTPQDQAVVIYNQLVKQDWKGVYSNIVFSEDELKTSPDAAAFAKQADALMNDGTVGPILQQAANGISDIKAGEPHLTHDGAEVPTSAKLTLNGISVPLAGTAHMVNDGGIWKLDATTKENGDSKRVITEMLGKIDTKAAGGSAPSR